ncbi:MAG: ABC transporter ATP-binding protein, partial [Halapricum sp.]
GCGKSTFLRLLSGLLELDAGEIEINADDADGRPATSLVFQEKGIFPWKSVLDNVAFGLKMRGVDKQRRYEIAREYIQKVNLSEFEGAYPHQLSGGMKQRVGIARAFANDPQILLMDEPFGDLDAQTKRYLQEELLSLWSESRKTVVYVTHDIEEAIQLGDRLGVMGARPGHVKEIIDVDLDRPRTRENLDIARLEELQTRVWDVLSDEVQRTVEKR